MSEITAGRKNGRPKGYAAWRPHRKTREVLEQVQDILEAYREHLPLTIRQIFYRLVGAYGYPKTEAAYCWLCEYLVRARRARVHPLRSRRRIRSGSYGELRLESGKILYFHHALHGERLACSKAATQCYRSTGAETTLFERGDKHPPRRKAGAAASALPLTSGEASGGLVR